MMEDDIILGDEKDLIDFIFVLFHNIVWIILVTVIFGGLGFGYSRYVATPKYQSSAMMIVNSRDESKTYVTSDQLHSAASLVDTYSIIINSDTVMDKAFESINYTGDPKAIKVDVSSVNETQIMCIAVTAKDPELAQKVCDAITKIAPEIIIDVVEAGSVKLVSSAKVDYRPTSPNLLKNLVLFSGAGFILICGIIFLMELLNNKIRSEQDIRRLDLTVVGIIPTYRKEKK